MTLKRATYPFLYYQSHSIVYLLIKLLFFTTINVSQPVSRLFLNYKGIKRKWCWHTATSDTSQFQDTSQDDHSSANANPCRYSDYWGNRGSNCPGTIFRDHSVGRPFPLSKWSNSKLSRKCTQNDSPVLNTSKRITILLVKWSCNAISENKLCTNLQYNFTKVFQSCQIYAVRLTTECDIEFGGIRYWQYLNWYRTSIATTWVQPCVNYSWQTNMARQINTYQQFPVSSSNLLWADK